jgi:hypothetical protein
MSRGWNSFKVIRHAGFSSGHDEKRVKRFAGFVAKCTLSICLFINEQA